MDVLLHSPADTARRVGVRHACEARGVHPRLVPRRMHQQRRRLKHPCLGRVVTEPAQPLHGRHAHRLVGWRRGGGCVDQPASEKEGGATGCARGHKQQAPRVCAPTQRLQAQQRRWRLLLLSRGCGSGGVSPPHMGGRRSRGRRCRRGVSGHGVVAHAAASRAHEATTAVAHAARGAAGSGCAAARDWRAAVAAHVDGATHAGTGAGRGRGAATRAGWLADR